MTTREYDGPPLDGTMEHLAERDLGEDAENVEVPQDDEYNGEISAEYGFLDDDELAKREKVERLWKRSDYDVEVHGSLTRFYEEEVSPVLDVSKGYVVSIVSEMTESTADNDSEEEGAEANANTTGDANTTDDTTEEPSKSLSGTNGEQLNTETYTRGELEHHLLKPIVFAKKFADGEELETLEETEELITVLINRGDDV